MKVIMNNTAKKNVSTAKAIIALKNLEARVEKFIDGTFVLAFMRGKPHFDWDTASGDFYCIPTLVKPERFNALASLGQVMTVDEVQQFIQNQRDSGEKVAGVSYAKFWC